MGRKKQSPDSVTTTGQGNYEKQPKVSNFDPQLKFSWYNPPLQETSVIAEEKTRREIILGKSQTLDRTDKKMQKITERLDKKAEPLPHPEFSFEDSIPPLPLVNEPPEAITPDDESKPIRELPENFIGKGEVKGFKFTQIKRSQHAYLYQVQNTGPVYYEVFERRVNTQFGNVSYPSKEAFGVSATTTGILQYALEIFEALNNRRSEACV